MLAWRRGEIFSRAGNGVRFFVVRVKSYVAFGLLGGSVLNYGFGASFGGFPAGGVKRISSPTPSRVGVEWVSGGLYGASV